jgi:formate dehydrogenase
MQVGTVAAGRISLRVLRLLKPFDVKLHYMDRHRLRESVEKELNLTRHTGLESLTKVTGRSPVAVYPTEPGTPAI